jgi:hypothetical protein
LGDSFVGLWLERWLASRFCRRRVPPSSSTILVPSGVRIGIIELIPGVSRVPVGWSAGGGAWGAEDGVSSIGAGTGSIGVGAPSTAVG